MDYNQFLERIINDGIAAASADYSEEKDKHRMEGSVAGFEACRNKEPIELLEVWNEAQQYVQAHFDHKDADKYWWFRCYQLEVEWVCNVVSAMLCNQGGPAILSWHPTCFAVQKAAEILGVTQSTQPNE